MRWAVGASACALLLAASQAAVACEGKVVLLEDHFESLSPLWTSTGQMGVTDGKLELKTKSSKSDKVFASPLYQDVDLCADMALIAGSNLPSIYLGLGFWATDAKNLYTFQISPSGTAGVYRLKDDTWETVVNDADSTAIHKGRDEVNSLRVVTVGKTATFYINGEQFGEPFTGEPPAAGQLVGFVAQASSQSSATFRFDDANATVPE